jgi:hypothetical protein
MGTWNMVSRIHSCWCDKRWIHQDQPDVLTQISIMNQIWQRFKILGDTRKKNLPKMEKGERLAVSDSGLLLFWSLKPIQNTTWSGRWKIGKGWSGVRSDRNDKIKRMALVIRELDIHLSRLKPNSSKFNQNRFKTCWILITYKKESILKDIWIGSRIHPFLEYKSTSLKSISITWTILLSLHFHSSLSKSHSQFIVWKPLLPKNRSNQLKKSPRTKGIKTTKKAI